MKVNNTKDYLELDFNRPNATWALLIVDDLWESVLEMVCGTYDSITGSCSSGLGSDSTNVEKALAYWRARGVGNDSGEKALLILPAVVIKAVDYSKVVFTGFPDSAKALAELPLWDKKVAVLIDVWDEGKRETRFPETWQYLDCIGHAHHARGRITKGGAVLPSWAEQINIVRKAEPIGGASGHIQEFLTWMGNVRGAINSMHFSQCTPSIPGHDPNASCHMPLNLRFADQATRTAVCHKLQQDDPYGVWRWCSELVLEEPLPARAPHRWLAGKAFNSSKNGSNAPLIALIAICEGARFLRVNETWRYEVESNLGNVTEDELSRSQLFALGQVAFARGVYHDFAAALRDWLTTPEQFENGNGRIAKISIIGNRDTARIQMIYTAILPDCIFKGPRVGRTRAAWLRLAVFADTSEYKGNSVTLTFSFKS